MGSFISPSMKLKRGSNEMYQDVGMSVSDTSLVLLMAVSFIEGHDVPMIISSDDVSVTVLGTTMSNLKMRKELTCTFLGNAPYPTPKEKFCHTSTLATHQLMARRLQNGFGFMMACRLGIGNNNTTVIV